MNNFAREYKKLNSAQREAVDVIDGPMLVVAGPGTGKTQLLSMRVANILRQTDTSPGSILCLTFTDNAARNMRERLEAIIGQPAYHVAIHTFHSFGSEVINQYPDFFQKRQLIQQVDELGSYELLREIFEELPHSNPLSTKLGDEFLMLRDSISAISWLKQSALTPTELQSIITANQEFIESLEEKLNNSFDSMPSPKNLNKYSTLLKAIQSKIKGKIIYGFPEYASEAASELSQAIDAVTSDSRYAPSITEWRNRWCEKNATGKYIFKDSGRNLRKMRSLAHVYEKLVQHMSEQGLYDFDDMIIEAVHAIEENTELKANLQERFQYVLVDEFQDTNKAQLRILEALGDNPLFENRPNIMAVGDDDQAIYSFQGAEVSNMSIFAGMYRQPKLINLIDNYRSSSEIINTALSIAGQITDRLNLQGIGANRQLIPQLVGAKSQVEQVVLPSELAQYDWVAEQVKQAIDKGTEPEQIAIIAPRHRYLERLVPYLANRNIPVAYERRENILDATIILQLITMAELVEAIADNRQGAVDELLPQIMSYDFWAIDSDLLIEISLDCYNRHLHWLPVLTKHKNPNINRVAKWFVSLAKYSKIEPLEYILDELLGSTPTGAESEYVDELPRAQKRKFVSPMRAYYFNQESYDKATDIYLAVLGQLSTLRQRLRQWKPASALYTADLIEFVKLHRQAHLKIIDTNPHTQTSNAVQVMTAYKAKGLEFDRVYLINAQDEVWGPTARKRSSRITLPRNLPIAQSGDTDNDKLRLLFVALTRAKRFLFVTSYSHNLENKLSPGLSYIGGNSDNNSQEQALLKPVYLNKPAGPQTVEILATDWAYRFRHVIADKPTLFEPILESYKLSVTHLNNFIDIVNGGPQYYFLHNLLRFPEALTPAAAYGDAIHKTMQWLYAKMRESGNLPEVNQTKDCFIDLLSRKHLRQSDYKRLAERGNLNLELYLKQRQAEFSATDLIERGFNNEGVVIETARLSGKIDKMHFLKNGELEVIDFKTGKPASDWKGKDGYEQIKLHKYRQQLLFYKLLVENSASYKGKTLVSSAALEFIEPNEQNKLVPNLGINFNAAELKRFNQLIAAVWQHIVSLNMPDTSSYAKNLSGVVQFEDDLIAGKI